MLSNIISKDFTLGSHIILAILFSILAFILINYAFRMIEMGYVLKYKKPLYNHFYFRKRQLNKNQRSILKHQFSFYKKLNNREQLFFEHRLASFIKDKDFIGRDGFVITDEVKVLIASTAVMLTFGFRDFYISFISKIVIYPNKFYSNTNKKYHKGEFNPRLKALVLFGEDFKDGYSDEKDNLNLGIHEITHAIHLNSLKERDVSSIIFNDSFKELTKLLAENEVLRNQLISSNYFRGYAYSNKFEYLAVAIENFIETPKAFKAQFPIVYNMIKQMLNFRIAGY